MPWPVIFVALVLALLLARLVRGLGWAPEWALLAVGGGAALFAIALLGLLVFLVSKTERGEMWRVFVLTVREDWTAVRNWFRW